MAGMTLPLPSVNFGKLLKEGMAKFDMPSQIIQYTKDGNITSNLSVPMGVITDSGEITDFLVALGNCGRDDTNDLGITADLKKNGTSIISGELSIDDSVSGEAGAAKFTANAPTFTSTAVVRGDMLSLDVTVTRTASPTTEMQDLYSAVKIVPAT